MVHSLVNSAGGSVPLVHGPIPVVYEADSVGHFTLPSLGAATHGNPR